MLRLKDTYLRLKMRPRSFFSLCLLVAFLTVNGPSFGVIPFLDYLRVLYGWTPPQQANDPMEIDGDEDNEGLIPQEHEGFTIEDETIDDGGHHATGLDLSLRMAAYGMGLFFFGFSIFEGSSLRPLDEHFL